MAKRNFIPGLADRLKAARAAAGVSQAQAAESSGVHAVQIAKYETNATTPTIAILYKLALAYKVTVCDLLPPAAEPAGEPKKGKKS